MFLDQFLAMKNMPKKIGEFLPMQLPTYASHVIHMHVDCAHRV